MKKIIIVTLFAFWFGGFCIFAYKINNFTTDIQVNTDAIIVLTGGRNRISEAAKLYNADLAKHMFISGVAKDITLENIQNTQHIKIKESKTVEIGYNAANTVENANETKEWVRKNNINSIRLVTSNYHIFRSLIEFRKHLSDTKILLHPVYSEYIEKKWWTSWQTFSLIFKEYNKFIYAYIRNKLQ